MPSALISSVWPPILGSLYLEEKIFLSARKIFSLINI
jgi:hypothetical protein